MKILSRNEQEEILKRISASQIICNAHLHDTEAFVQITKNLSDIIIMVGGLRGVEKVNNKVKKYFDENYYEVKE